MNEVKKTDWPLINLIACIVALVLGFCGFFILPICFIVPGIVTLITSIILYVKTKDKKAMVGIILSVVAILVCCASMVIGAASYATLQNQLNNLPTYSTTSPYRY